MLNWIYIQMSELIIYSYHISRSGHDVGPLIWLKLIIYGNVQNRLCNVHKTKIIDHKAHVSESRELK